MIHLAMTHFTWRPPSPSSPTPPGTEGAAVRVIDLATCCCFVSPRLNEHHTDSITSIKYSSDGRMFASSSKDGDIKASLTANTFMQGYGVPSSGDILVSWVCKNTPPLASCLNFIGLMFKFHWIFFNWFEYFVRIH